MLPKQAYTPWATRVVAFLVDWAPIWLIVFVPLIGLLIAGDMECIDSIYGTGGSYCYRQGRTGQSVGKSVMKFKVVSEKTWQPIGFWLSFVRQLAHYVDQLICYVGYLWPLWDDKRQTLADKIMGTVCVPLNTQPPPPPQWLPAPPQQY